MDVGGDALLLLQESQMVQEMGGRHCHDKPQGQPYICMRTASVTARGEQSLVQSQGDINSLSVAPHFLLAYLSDARVVLFSLFLFRFSFWGKTKK